MNWGSPAEFFAMGGHGVYVWAVYGVAALVMGALVVRPLRRHARHQEVGAEVGEHRHLRVEQRHVDPLAFARVLAALGVAVGLVLNAFNSNLVFFYSPTQVAANEAPQGRTFRVGGMVVRGSLEREPDSLAVRFRLTDGDRELWVRYAGILPDLFAEGEAAVAAGHLRHLAQRGFVQLQVHRHAFAHRGMAVGRAQADDVDAHAAVGGHLGGFDRVHAGGAAAVAEQDDRRRFIRTRRHRLDLLGRRLLLHQHAVQVEHHAQHPVGGRVGNHQRGEPVTVVADLAAQIVERRDIAFRESAAEFAALPDDLGDAPADVIALLTTAPIAVAPAMNRVMWDHAATQANDRLQALGVPDAVLQKILGAPLGA